MTRTKLTRESCRRLGSPWGDVQSAVDYGEGLLRLSTASHGGFYLSTAALCREFRAALPGFRPWVDRADCAYLEEDCDACAAVIVFRRLFEPAEIAAAIRQIRGMAKRPDSSMWVEVVALIDSSPELLAVERQEEERTRDLWERGSMGTCFHKGKEYADCWWVSFRRGDEATQRICRGYPDKQWYSDDELNAMEAA